MLLYNNYSSQKLHTSEKIVTNSHPGQQRASRKSDFFLLKAAMKPPTSLPQGYIMPKKAQSGA
jgi:hypothetical protein